MVSMVVIPRPTRPPMSSWSNQNTIQLIRDHKVVWDINLDDVIADAAFKVKGDF